jgi:hypothetical protein
MALAHTRVSCHRSQCCYMIGVTARTEDFDGVGLGLWCNVRIEHKQTSSSIWASQFRHGLLLVNSLVDNAHGYSQSLILLSRSDDLDTERGAQVYCPVHHLLVP